MTRRLLHVLALPLLALVFSTGATAATPPGKQAPTNTTLPTVTGTTEAGRTLTATAGGWSGNNVSYSFQWLKCDSAGNACGSVAGETSSSHLIPSTEAGSTLRVLVTAQNKNGSATATSPRTAVVSTPAAPAPTPPAPAPTPTPTPPLPSPSPPPPPPAPAGQNGRFGVSTGGSIQNLTAGDLTRYLDGAAAAHTGWIRFDINWSVVQLGGPTSYIWTPFDNVVREAAARGIKVLAMIAYTPSWARPGGTSDKTPPTNLADYASFVQTAVARYSGMGVHAYEIWNEPNIVNFWSPAPDAARYTQMLKLAYSAAKSVDPSATVVNGGLSPYGAYGQRDAGHVNPLTFLDEMYANGAGGSFDALSWHPYNYPWGLGYYNWSAWSQMSETTPSARSIMSARSDGAKQVWATEFGAPTGSTTRDLTEAAQAQLVTDSYAKLKAWSWAGPAFLYSYRDNGTNKSDVEQNFGILHFDWSPKLSYTAYQAAAAAG